MAEAGVQEQVGSSQPALPGTLHSFALDFTFSTAKHCHGAVCTATCAPGPGKDGIVLQC